VHRGEPISDFVLQMLELGGLKALMLNKRGNTDD